MMRALRFGLVLGVFNLTKGNEMTNNEKALGEAIAAIYFDDSSDYESALWIIIKLLGGEYAVDMLEKNRSEAYKLYAQGRNLST